MKQLIQQPKWSNYYVVLVIQSCTWEELLRLLQLMVLHVCDSLMQCRIPLIPCFNQVLQQQFLKNGKFQPQIGVYMYLQFHHIYMAMTTHKVHIITLIHSWCLYHLCISKTIMRKRVVCLSQQNKCHGVVWTTHSCCHTIHITIIVMLQMGKVMFI